MPNKLHGSNEQQQEAGPSWSNENQDSFFNTSRSSAFFDQNYASSSNAAFDPFQEEEDVFHGNSDKAPVNNFNRNNYKYHDYDNSATIASAFATSETEQEEDGEEAQQQRITSLTKKKMPKAEPMTIRIDDPVKSSDGSYIIYQVFTMTALEMYSTDKRPVRRRFRDFVWLHNALTNAFPACVIPPLPEKHRFKYMKGDRFDPGFIEQRRLGLQWFVDRIARHPLLQRAEYTRIFLESTDFNTDKHIKLKNMTHNASTSSIFGSLFKSFVKVKKPDEKFEEMKDTIDKFEDNLNIVEKIYSRIGKRQQELENNYNHFATSIRGLSALETIVDQPLRQFAEATEMYAEALKEMRKQENLSFLNDVHELLNYCHAAKDQLVERDRKQVQFEDLSNALQSITFERDRILHPGKNLGQITSTANSATAAAAITSTSTSMNITELMADKFTNNKSDRLMRLEKKIKELQENVSKANDENNNFSDQMLNEYDVFQKAKDSELRQGLAAYADCHIDFYLKSISIWENILPVLEQIQPQQQVDEQ
ncbi:hypothetical protein BDF20DRAFT_846048 [Mycotypha africana]|uniref:uncharacterized protein n=1 Tax=Mycotypha africana TaxID=64632 RepID=UPI0022FFD9EC|nr:uncharacterized protein BDF20DRAFT_846048 [Mycotypha africana]KAI8991722.1 hypothetical protein BDF20DRAFT_846048 [Mycotypha africana]